ncbi:MAG: hypothetical protein C0617_00920 [Desulfuromonas sp.]|uniref:hypothetical protein n=1 Tax=Desulfuromonas sp. TaxID=892 RepID=UPI000CC03268|nr:hypothetical protein [Desulfuromonas sp.]PLX86506.1 MAG: hypothetical protein C0617_00920 [Desulfuromonas sp.]
MKRFLAVSAALLFLAGCCAPAGSETRPAQSLTNQSILEITGTVVFLQMEGGFFGILGDDGMRYDPVDLPAELRRDGKKVRLRVRPMEKTIGFHMWGRKVEILQAEPL